MDTGAFSRRKIVSIAPESYVVFWNVRGRGAGGVGEGKQKRNEKKLNENIRCKTNPKDARGKKWKMNIAFPDCTF